MDENEYKEIMFLMQHQINSIIHHQIVLAEIKSDLESNIDSPFEQDYIYQIHYGSLPSEPITKIINGVKITTRILHQTGKGLSDIKGADLLYEIKDEKFALIQYKRASKERVELDERQLDEMLSRCPNVCIYYRKPPKWSPMKFHGFCGLFFAVINNGQVKFVHACEAKTIFKGQKSVGVEKFKTGLSQNIFDELFASCRVGALINIEKSGYYIEKSLSLDYMILHVLQEGRW